MPDVATTDEVCRKPALSKHWGPPLESLNLHIGGVNELNTMNCMMKYSQFSGRAPRRVVGRNLVQKMVSIELSMEEWILQTLLRMWAEAKLQTCPVCRWLLHRVVAVSVPKRRRAILHGGYAGLPYATLRFGAGRAVRNACKLPYPFATLPYLAA